VNRHFDDAKYYLRRAAQTAKEGVKEEIEPVEDRVRELTGREEEPDPTRLEQVQSRLDEIEEQAEGEARRAVTSAKGRIRRYRSDE
jgi:hypothetical protein